MPASAPQASPQPRMFVSKSFERSEMLVEQRVLVGRGQHGVAGNGDVGDGRAGHGVETQEPAQGTP